MKTTAWLPGATWTPTSGVEPIGRPSSTTLAIGIELMFSVASPAASGLAVLSVLSVLSALLAFAAPALATTPCCDVLDACAGLSLGAFAVSAVVGSVERSDTDVACESVFGAAALGASCACSSTFMVASAPFSTEMARAAVGVNPGASTLTKCVPVPRSEIVQGDCSQRTTPSANTRTPLTGVLLGPAAVTTSEPVGFLPMPRVAP